MRRRDRAIECIMKTCCESSSVLYICVRGHLECLQRRYVAGSDIMWPIRRAAGKGRVDCLAWLLPRSNSNEKRHALLGAIEFNQPICVDIILRYGGVFVSERMLKMAALYTSLDCVRLLIPTMLYHTLKTCLISCLAVDGLLDAMKCVMNTHSRVYDGTAAYVAAQYGHEDCVVFLSDYAATFQVTSWKKRDVIHYWKKYAIILSNDYCLVPGCASAKGKRERCRMHDYQNMACLLGIRQLNLDTARLIMSYI